MGLSVLFVDDDQGILQAAGRVLRMERPDIEFHLSSDPAEALRAMESAAFDAVVADYRMPGMDGLAFLREVRERHPGVKRVLLSGQMEEGVYEKASALTDRYLAKPCDTMTIIREIEKLISHNDTKNGGGNETKGAPC